MTKSYKKKLDNEVSNMEKVIEFLRLDCEPSKQLLCTLLMQDVAENEGRVVDEALRYARDLDDMVKVVMSRTKHV